MDIEGLNPPDNNLTVIFYDVSGNERRGYEIEVTLVFGDEDVRKMTSYMASLGFGDMRGSRISKRSTYT